MPETLKELKKRGVKLGVCSNKPHEAAVKVVERMFGSQIFDAVMGQSDSVRKKPAPDGPLKIAEQFGIKPEECMYLGDSGTDMQTGKAAGMYTVGVLWGYREKEELLKMERTILWILQRIFLIYMRKNAKSKILITIQQALNSYNFYYKTGGRKNVYRGVYSDIFGKTGAAF